MIPHVLQIKNFISYGPELQIIDFSNYNLICLSGKNGHGKSALLDAMTWAVWGQARKVSGAAKADEGLLHLGQTHMLVIFDFSFNEELYRIRREFSKAYGKSFANLEFGIFNNDNSLIPLTDKTIRTTQQKIEKTIGLDFDAFSNSAFLRQGNANEFSKKSPKDRKTILATILGLDKYEAIRKRAMEKAKIASTEKNVLSAFQEKLIKELETFPTINTDILQVSEQLKQLTTKEKEINIEKKEHLKEENTIAEKQKQSAMLTFRYEQLLQGEKKYQTQLNTLVSEWRTIHKKSITHSNKQELEKEKNILVKTINTYQQQLQKTLEYKEQSLIIKEQLQKKEQVFQEKNAHKKQEKQLALERLIFEQKSVQEKIDESKQQIKILEQEQKAITKKLQTITDLHTQNINKELFKRHEQQFEKRKATYQHFVSLGNWLNNELQSLQQKKKLAHDDNDPSCPLCEQNLSASRRRFLKSQFAQQERFLHHRLKRLSSIIPKLKSILVMQHKIIQTDTENIKQEQIQQLTVTQLLEQTKKLAEIITQYAQENKKKSKQIIQITNAIIEQKKETIQLTDTITILNQDSNYKKLKIEYTQYEQKLSQVIYNQTKHTDTQKQLQIIEEQLFHHAILEKELHQQEQRQNSITQLCITLKQFKKEKKTILEQQKLYQSTAKDLQIISEKKELLQKKQNVLLQEKETLLEKKGSLQTLQQKLIQIQHECTTQKKKIAELNTTIHDYQIIATATSKDGIQALLIEDTIPEIEQEANNILSKLTNNQAHIIIDSLRDLKKGGTKETLDIKISDTVGIRPYELFSGGEAFRIDFALRIAISKLLARRAGTALQTLIIDEGFGSQDEEGLSHIMDAIHKIQDDFSKIIIVSHLDMLKDQFPVHFVIEKSTQGSKAHVIELG